MMEHLPHSPFRKLDQNLWWLDGKLPSMPMPRAMVIYKTQEGGVVVHSAVAVDSARQKEMESLGQPKWMIVPSALHRMDAPKYKAAYPSLKVLAPKIIKKKVEEVIAVDDSCESALPAAGVIVHSVPGIKPIELAYEVTLSDGKKALLFNDMLMNLPHLPGFKGLLVRWMGSTGFFGITWLGRTFLMNDRAKFRAWLIEQSQRKDVSLLTVSHGEPVVGYEAVSAHLSAAAGRL